MAFFTLLLISGFLLMTGPEDSGTGRSGDMFNFRHITLSPLIIIASYIGFIWLILKKTTE